MKRRLVALTIFFVSLIILAGCKPIFINGGTVSDANAIDNNSGKYEIGDLINLTGQTQVTLKVNKLAVYQFYSYSSVGYSSKYEISDNSIVSCIDSKTDYKHPEAMKPGSSGGDEATGTFVFKALKPGKTTIVIKDLYRGNVKNENKIEITVLD
ncbi:MAG: hypothetical protein ABRQ26_12360 [Syntrophomonadaceae bacterium]